MLPLFAVGSTRAATPGLVAAYSFNEGSGTTVGDASGTGNNGTTSNTTWSASGKYGGALSFNGTSARVNIPNSCVAAADDGDDARGVGQPVDRDRARGATSSTRATTTTTSKATSDNAGKPAGGGTFGGSERQRLRHRRADREHLVVSGPDVRRRDAPALRQRDAGRRARRRRARSRRRRTSSRSAATASTASTSAVSSTRFASTTSR